MKKQMENALQLISSAAPSLQVSQPVLITIKKKVRDFQPLV